MLKDTKTLCKQRVLHTFYSNNSHSFHFALNTQNIIHPDLLSLSLCSNYCFFEDFFKLLHYHMEIRIISVCGSVHTIKASIKKKKEKHVLYHHLTQVPFQQGDMFT